MAFTRTAVVVALAPVVVLGLAACAVDPGGGASASGAPSSQSAADLTALPQIDPDPDLAGQVPADVRSGGLVVATSSNLPPMTYVEEDGSTLVGFDVDMAHAIGEVLDVDTQVTTAGFDTIIPGLQAGRYSMAMSSLGVTEERLAAVDFVNYYLGGQGFLATAATDFEVSDLEDLCGRRVAVGTGSVQESTLQDQSGSCADAGLDPWEVQVFPNVSDAVLAISSDRVDVFYASISIVAYTAGQNDVFRLAGRYSRAIVGAALPQGSPMTPLVQQAVQQLIDDGTYAQLLDKWDLDDNAIQTAEVNTIPPTD